MNIVLNRESPFSLRAQVALQIEVAIVTGSLAAGKKLPSVRELARRIGLHHNTIAAAYAELTERGLIEARRGSGLYVSMHGEFRQPEDATDIHELIASSLEAALARGFTAGQIRAAIEIWMRRQPPDHVVIVEPAPDIRAILQHEIASALPCRVDARGLDAFDQPGSLEGVLVVSSFYHSAAIRAKIGPTIPLVTISLNPGDSEIERLRALPVGAMLGIVSGSPVLLATVSMVISSMRGNDILVRPVPFSETNEWVRLARTADRLVCDSLSGEAVERRTKKQVKIVRLVPEETLEKLKTYFEKKASKKK